MYRTGRVLTAAGVWRFCFGGGPQFPPLDPLVKWRLRDLLRPEIEILEDLLHRDLSNWKNATTRAPAAASSEIIQAEVYAQLKRLRSRRSSRKRGAAIPTRRTVCIGGRVGHCGRRVAIATGAKLQ